MFSHSCSSSICQKLNLHSLPKNTSSLAEVDLTRLSLGRTPAVLLFKTSLLGVGDLVRISACLASPWSSVWSLVLKKKTCLLYLLLNLCQISYEISSPYQCELLEYTLKICFSSPLSRLPPLPGSSFPFHSSPVPLAHDGWNDAMEIKSCALPIPNHSGPPCRVTEAPVSL